MNLDDFKIKFICKFDYTFWLHLVREFIITFGLSVFLMLLGYVFLLFRSIEIVLFVPIGFAIGFNLAYEVQDGLKGWGCNRNKLIIEGFNWLDFLAGLIGTGIGIILFWKLFVI